MTPVYKLSANSVKNGRTVYGSMLAGNPVFEIPGDFKSIATTTVGSGGTSEIIFNSIPSGFTHLQIRGIARTARTTFANDGLKLQFNSDTNTNYSRHQLSGDASGGKDLGGAADADYMFSQVAGNGASANVFGPCVIDILDYANTNKYKTVRFFTGVDNNSSANQQSGYVSMSSGSWRNTNAITSLRLFGFSGNLLQYTSLALYGIKVAS